MNHLDNITIQALVDGTLGPEERKSVRRHAAQCPECARLVSRMTAIDTALRLEAIDKPSSDFTDRVMHQLRGAVSPKQAGSTHAVWGYFANLFALLMVGAIIYSSTILMRQFVPAPEPLPAATSIVPESSRVQHYAHTAWESVVSGSNSVLSVFSSKNPLSVWIICVFVFSMLFVIDRIVGRRWLHIRI